MRLMLSLASDGLVHQTLRSHLERALVGVEQMRRFAGVFGHTLLHLTEEQIRVVVLHLPAGGVA